MKTGCITSFAPGGYSPISRGYSHKGQVESDGGRQHRHDKLDLSREGLDLSRGLMGKLNALTHSASGQDEPKLLKSILEKLTGQKIDDVDVDSLQITKSMASLDVTQITAQSQPGSTSLTYEHLAAQAREMSVSIEGSMESKSGAEVDFALKLDVSQVVAAYQRYSMSALQTSAPALSTTA